MNRGSSLLRVLVACFSFFPIANGLAETLEGKVISVTDGDTITVMQMQDRVYSGWIIRLTGIDAPEKGQPFGNVARQYLAGIVFQQTVTVEWEKRDRYGRTLGKVLMDGVDVNLEMIRTGHAWVYLSAERDARTERRGLWLDPVPVPPWEWRKRR